MGKQLLGKPLLPLIAAAVLSGPVLADVPLTARSLGMMESTFAVCATADTQAASKYQARVSAMTRKIPEKDLARVRDSALYREVFESTTSALSQAPHEDLVRTCTELLAHNESFAKPAH